MEAKMKAAVLMFILVLPYCAGEEGYFWQFTDLHWDFSYATAHLSCNRKNVSDRGPYGDYLCDSPWDLIQETIKQAEMIKPDVDFIAWTGDNVPHISAKNLSTDINIQVIGRITELLKSHFPWVQVYPIFGNHDYYKDAQFPPHNNELYNATYLLWKPWIGDKSQEQSFLKGGYYTAKTKYGLRIIALNTNFYYKDKVTKDLDDPADHFAWLDAQLSAAATNNEKVLLLGHVPPGFASPNIVRFMYANFNKKFIDIVLRHSDVITATHFGHEHCNSFRLFYNSSGSPVVPLFVAPSVTPVSYEDTTSPRHNPAVRLVKFDRQTGRPLDILQYYVDLPKANLKHHVNLTLGYIATREYGIPDVTPGALARLASMFKNATSPEFKAYMKWYTSNAIEDYPCDKNCHKVVLCAIGYLKEDEFSRCLASLVN